MQITSRLRAPNGMPPSSRAITATEQVREILRAADREADARRREVEEWARTRLRDIEQQALSYLEEATARSEALVTERLDPVLALAALVEDHAERAIALLGEADAIRAQLRQLVGELRDGFAPAPRDRFAPAPRDGAAPPGPEPAPPPPPPPTVAPPAADAGDDEAVRLLALQMAMQGATRGEVERSIRDEFRAGDPQALLDDVFGAATGPSHRIAWNADRGAG